MPSAQDHIARLQVLLDEIEQHLSRYDEAERREEVYYQLRSVEQSIQRLQKKGMPIPDGLRRTKLELMQQLEAYEQARHLRKEALAHCRQFVAAHKSSRQRLPRHGGQLNLFDDQPPQP